MAKKQFVNRWKEHHDYLEQSSRKLELSKATSTRDEICRLMGWSTPTYYRKLQNPVNLAISDKITIANVYDMPIHFLFPEMENEPA